ncbi:hypothetical protein [Mycoplasmopsis californica]|uniref:hypothetical protein n=1 Tax=Mycoplasmopsis californica TaxID=2113 RepID=UPI000A57D0F4|nr:hypothetical protein [Mycoplasmopsis californica]
MLIKPLSLLTFRFKELSFKLYSFNSCGFKSVDLLMQELAKTILLKEVIKRNFNPDF